MKHSFNLIDQPWIPCIALDGGIVELSLRDVLINAHRLKMLAAETPLHNVGIITVMLAILHRIFGPADMRAWEQLWGSEQFPPDPIEDYLQRWHHRFDLFDDQRPFYQADDKRVDEKSIIHLIYSMGNTGALFTHENDEVEQLLRSAEAARVLLAAQLFRCAGLSGLPQKFTDAIYTRGILFYAEGDSIYQTSLLNMPPYPNPQFFPITGDDRPCWEMDDPYVARSIPYGYLDYLTWQPTFVRLIPKETEMGVAVSRMRIAPALPLDAVIKSPQKLYRIKSTKDGERWISQRFNEGRVLWRDYDTFLEDNELTHLPACLRWLSDLRDSSDYFDGETQYWLRVMGLLADQAKPIFIRDQRLPLPLDYLNAPNRVAALRQAKVKAEETYLQLYFAQKTLAQRLVTHGGTREPDKNDISNLISHWSTESFYWNQLEVPFWQLVNELPADMDNALFQWEKTLREMAISVFDQTVQSLGPVSGLERGAVEGRKKLNIGLKKTLGD